MGQSDIRTRRIADSVSLVDLVGEHDRSTAPELQFELDGVFTPGGSIVVDLSAATFIDSSILGVLLRAEVRTSRRQGEQFAVVAPKGGAAARLFDLVDAAHTCFPTFESLDDAVESCGAHTAVVGRGGVVTSAD
ncbi:MAG TPA: STAS domain-containing protein [Gaiellales bacterium]|nr:STAS domain-containing protein [Gaiellales bacterium]